MGHTSLKQELLDFCKNFANSRISRLKTNIEDTQKALTSETKSSAGDKHETGRAMIQLEREKLGYQLAEAEKMTQLLSRITIHNDAPVISLGSLVFTSKAVFFLCLSAGEFKNQSSIVFCISAATPIGKLLIGKQANDSFVFNNERITITDFH